MSSYNETKSYSLSTTVLKTLQILEYIAGNQPATVPAICRACHFTRANVHRLLATLSAAGYVIRRQDGYELTAKVALLGSKVPLNRDLRDAAKPAMVELERIAHENIYLNVRSEDVIIAIEEVKSPHHVVLNPDVTFTYPVNSCASGKLLLSAYTDDEIQSYMSSIDMVRRTEHTITDVGQYLEEVAAVRKQGYALEILEFSSDLNSVAAPIYDSSNRIVATISISGPAMRLTSERIGELVAPLTEYARKISETLQYNNRFFFTEKKQNLPKEGD